MVADFISCAAVVKIPYLISRSWMRFKNMEYCFSEGWSTFIFLNVSPKKCACSQFAYVIITHYREKQNTSDNMYKTLVQV